MFDYNWDDRPFGLGPPLNLEALRNVVYVDLGDLKPDIISEEQVGDVTMGLCEIMARSLLDRCPRSEQEKKDYIKLAIDFDNAFDRVEDECFLAAR